MTINKNTIYSQLLFDKEIKYNDSITLYPIRMKDIVDFQLGQAALTLRKDSIFKSKKFIKMRYWEFIKFTNMNIDLAKEYKMEALPFYYMYALQVLIIACGDECNLTFDKETFDVYINDCLITDDIFDDLRKIIILQNDIDFDVDEFMNIDTLEALNKAKEFEAKKANEKYELEDYIDSLAVAMHYTLDYIESMTIRKFWRYIKRINKHEEHQAAKNGEMSGMVTFKKPIPNWMSSMEVDDKYEGLKADAKEIKEKLG